MESFEKGDLAQRAPERATARDIPAFHEHQAQASIIKGSKTPEEMKLQKWRTGTRAENKKNQCLY